MDPNTNAFIQMHYVTREVYDAGTPIDSHLYFISDEKAIYRGTELYTAGVRVFTATTEQPLPENPVPGCLYIESETGRIVVFGDDKQPVVNVVPGGSGEGGTTPGPIEGVDTEVKEDSKNPVTGGAVYTYVTEQIKAAGGFIPTFTDLTWDATEHVLTVKKSDNTTSTIVLDGLGCSLQMNSTTGVLSLLDAKGAVVGEGVNLGLDRFVAGGEYNPETKNIILYFDEEKTDKLEIPVGDLVDEYTVENSATVNLTMLNNKISAAVRISKEEGNMLSAKEDGLFVGASDVTNKVVQAIVTDAPATTPAAASTDKTVSERVFVESMTWKTTM